MQRIIKSVIAIIKKQAAHQANITSTVFIFIIAPPLE